MNYLQQLKPSSAVPEDSKLLSLVLGVNLVLIVLFFALNFIGSPMLKYVYLITIIFSIFATLFLNFLNLLPVIISLYFIEGQGRILWNNVGWTKFIFDAIVLLSILKIFISNKKIYNIQKLPKTILLLIILHFCWYLFAVFNLDTVSSIAAVVSSKLYVYPILYFLALTQVEFDVYSIKFERFLNFLIFLLFIESFLILIQYYLKENFVLEISPHYQTAMKQYIYTGSTYRPFGTSFSPGSISVFFYLTLGFLFLKLKNFKWNFLSFLLIPLLTFTIILCQIRSALLKFVLIYLLIQIGDAVFKRFRLKELLKLLVVISIFLIGANYIANFDVSSNGSSYSSKEENETHSFNEGIENVRDRFTSLSDTKTLKSSRINVTRFYVIAVEKLASKPFGYGPGFTGILGRLGMKETGFTSVKNEEYWAWDNLFMSLLIELGFGAIFYILLLFYIPIFLFQFLIRFYKLKMEKEYRVLLVCFSTLTIMLFGNWGVIGITYNPESFVFWFFAALGFGTIAKYKNGHVINEKYE